MTVWREEDLAAAHAGGRLDRRDLIGGGFDHEEYAAQRKLADKAKEFYDKVGEQAIKDLLDGGYTAGNCQGYATTERVHDWSATNSVEELKKFLSAGVGVPNMSRAYLVVPPEFKLPEIQFVPFEGEEQTKSRMWRHSWGGYNFGMPVVVYPTAFAPHHCRIDEVWTCVDPEPVLPRLMAEHVEVEQPRDLSAWQALVFVVVVGTILCLLGGVL